MTLLEGEISKDFIVAGMHLSDTVMRRLEALGIFEGTRVKILGKKRLGALIIKVRGTRWALGREIARGIQVEENSDERDH